MRRFIIMNAGNIFITITFLQTIALWVAVTYITITNPRAHWEVMYLPTAIFTLVLLHIFLKHIKKRKK